MQSNYLKKKNLPDKPGVYFFKHGKEILYIGKATSLRDRVKSYFGSDLIEARGPILVDMVFQADKIDWEVTDSVLEAIILEANLIKKFQPKYNTKEKSDKSFNYVCITKEELPKVIIVRGQELNKEHQNFHARGSRPVLREGRSAENFDVLCGNSFGPYPNSSQLREALKIIRPIFPFLDDKSENYHKFYEQINLVPNTLNSKGIKQYKSDIKNLKLFFEGKKKRVLLNLQKQMKEYAKKREFEKAGEIKRQIFALQHINDVALMKRESAVLSFRIEAYDVAHMSGKNMVGVMVVVEDGEVAKSEYKKFKIRTQNNSNDTGALVEVLERRLAHKEWPYPNLIVVDGGVAQINSTRAVLAGLSIDIPVVSVLKDEHHKPKDIMGDRDFSLKYQRDILLANSEAHRFAIAYHKKMRNKNFLK